MKYRTKQRTALMEYLRSVKGQHITVSDIRVHFEEQGRPIGTTTLYRQVDELVREGVLQKYIVDENSPACFAYIGEQPTDAAVVHCKCQKCGRLLHIRCSQFEEVQRHLSGNHAFVVDPRRTVLYGVCDQCR